MCLCGVSSPVVVLGLFVRLLMYSFMVIVDFGWNITSVFFMLILRPTLMMHWQTHQQSSGSPLLSGQLVRCRLQKAVLSQVYLWFLSSL